MDKVYSEMGIQHPSILLPGFGVINLSTQRLKVIDYYLCRLAEIYYLILLLSLFQISKLISKIHAHDRILY